jgi:hypothetical protein
VGRELVSAVELDNTSRCPLGHRCQSCGVERDDLTVITIAFDVLDVACLTLCPRCARSTATALGLCRQAVTGAAVVTGSGLVLASSTPL